MPLIVLSSAIFLSIRLVILLAFIIVIYDWRSKNNHLGYFLKMQAQKKISFIFLLPYNTTICFRCEELFYDL